MRGIVEFLDERRGFGMIQPMDGSAGSTTDERQRLKDLERENRELKRAE